MRQNISMVELRKSPGNIFDDVRHKGDTYVVERNKKPVAIIKSIEADEEHQRLIVEKVEALETKIRNDAALSHDEYSFLVEHSNYSMEDGEIYCNQQVMDTMSQLGGAFGIEDLPQEKLEGWVEHNKQELSTSS